MPDRLPHGETHFISRIGWLRAAVLGANDGIVSTASLVVGVSAAAASQQEVLLAGIAGMVAGAMSMAAGEYVSVSSQADTEAADIEREKQELRDEPEFELRELTEIYVERGLTRELAGEVARQLMAGDPLAAHARDELGISEITTARPIQAAFASAASFGAGAALPLVVAALSPLAIQAWAISLTSLLCLAILGALGARAGGASPWRAAARVMFWGALAMLVTWGIGHLVGAVI